MNLELLDPFGRQVPDRIDSTLHLPPSLHFFIKAAESSSTTIDPTPEPPLSRPNHHSKIHNNNNNVVLDDDPEWKAAYHLSFNRRGTYLAVGYGSSAVAVFNVLSRSLCALYPSDHQEYHHRSNHRKRGVSNPKQRAASSMNYGVTSITWSRKSRTFLTGAVGDNAVRLYDTSHRFGSEQACKGVHELPHNSQFNPNLHLHPPNGNSKDGEDEKTDIACDSDSKTQSNGHPVFVPTPTLERTKCTSFLDPDIIYSYSNDPRYLPLIIISMGETIKSHWFAAPATPESARRKVEVVPAATLEGAVLIPEVDKELDPSDPDPLNPEPEPEPEPTSRHELDGSAEDEDSNNIQTAASARVEIETNSAQPAHQLSTIKTGSKKSIRINSDWNATKKKRLSSHDQTLPPQHHQEELLLSAATATSSSSSSPLSSPNLSSRAQSTGNSKQNYYNVSDLRPLLLKHPYVSFEFPSHPVGGALQVCPRVSTGGLAALADGSLVLFWAPPDSFVSHRNAEDVLRRTAEHVVQKNHKHHDVHNTVSSPLSLSPTTTTTTTVLLIPLWNNTEQHHITCASFDHHGDCVYAATQDGTLLGFKVQPIWSALREAYDRAVTTFNNNDDDDDHDCDEDDEDDAMSRDDKVETTTALKHPRTRKKRIVPVVVPHIQCHISTATTTTAWHVLVSRNGKYLVVNSSDGALRLFRTADLSLPKSSSPPPKPRLFQDLVSKVKFVCCDLSGDGEYLVGGANGMDTKYELYIWNTTTGSFLDKLTGPPLELYSVTWHPSRNFLAVGTSDGLIDVWGPRVNWTAFAPDFQALPHNVEYVENEDEFDMDPISGQYIANTTLSSMRRRSGGFDEDEPVDVTTIEKVPVFASDSEEEENVFHYEVRLVNLLADRKFK